MLVLASEARPRTLCTGRPGKPALGGASRFVRIRRPGYVLEEVRTLAVDDIVPADRKVTIIQLDVEGWEEHALKGALGTIRRNLPLLILENAPKDAVWFDKTILKLGYQKMQRLPNNSVLRSLSDSQFS
ncbi:MAG: FkbM family methyltransferase [Rhizomicrobium sp.]